MRVRSGWGEALEDIPFELVGKVASACAVAEAGDVERGAAAARHACLLVTCGGYIKVIRNLQLRQVEVTVTVWLMIEGRKRTRKYWRQLSKRLD
jgi:hypothetical protein